MYSISFLSHLQGSIGTYDAMRAIGLFWDRLLGCMKLSVWLSRSIHLYMSCFLALISNPLIPDQDRPNPKDFQMSFYGQSARSLWICQKHTCSGLAWHEEWTLLWVPVIFSCLRWDSMLLWCCFCPFQSDFSSFWVTFWCSSNCPGWGVRRYLIFRISFWLSRWAMVRVYVWICCQSLNFDGRTRICELWGRWHYKW